MDASSTTETYTIGAAKPKKGETSNNLFVYKATAPKGKTRVIGSFDIENVTNRVTLYRTEDGHEARTSLVMPRGDAIKCVQMFAATLKANEMQAKKEVVPNITTCVKIPAVPDNMINLVSSKFKGIKPKGWCTITTGVKQATQWATNKPLLITSGLATDETDFTDIIILCTAVDQTCE
jgi:hypothetical protein